MHIFDHSSKKGKFIVEPKPKCVIVYKYLCSNLQPRTSYFLSFQNFVHNYLFHKSDHQRSRYHDRSRLFQCCMDEMMSNKTNQLTGSHHNCDSVFGRLENHWLMRYWYRNPALPRFSRRLVNLSTFFQDRNLVHFRSILRFLGSSNEYQNHFQGRQDSNWCYSSCCTDNIRFYILSYLCRNFFWKTV